MSDERIESALRQGPPDEPVYVAGLTPAVLDRRGDGARGRTPRSRSSVVTSFAQTTAAAALIMVVAVGVVIRSGVLEPAATPPSLLADATARGVIRIAVRPDRPQVTVSGSAPSGFDVDVATEIGRRLGLRVELVFTPIEDMLGGSGDWDVALPSTSMFPRTFASTRPYYDWPVRLEVLKTSQASAVADLTGSTICVVAGSSGEAWLDGAQTGSSATPVVIPPAPSAVRRLPTDDACVADVTAGRSTALVTATSSDADLATRPSLRPIDGPVLTEGRPVIARDGGRDPASLIAEIDSMLETMRDDGTLADLSRSRFGGLDLTHPPTP